MSYDIVRSVKVVDDKVFVTSASNNVRPRSYHPWEITYRNEVNPFTGKTAAEVEVLAGYESGNFQGGSNRFTRALEVLLHMPEYKDYSWRGNTLEWKPVDKAYYELLHKALQTPLPKSKFVISKVNTYGETVYFRQRRGASFARWTCDIKRATKFNYLEDAEQTKGYFPNSGDWIVRELA